MVVSFEIILYVTLGLKVLYNTLSLPQSTVCSVGSVNEPPNYPAIDIILDNPMPHCILVRELEVHEHLIGGGLCAIDHRHWWVTWSTFLCLRNFGRVA